MTSWSVTHTTCRPAPAAARTSSTGGHHAVAGARVRVHLRQRTGPRAAQATTISSAMRDAARPRCCSTPTRGTATRIITSHDSAGEHDAADDVDDVVLAEEHHAEPHQQAPRERHPRAARVHAQQRQEAEERERRVQRRERRHRVGVEVLVVRRHRARQGGADDLGEAAEHAVRLRVPRRRGGHQQEDDEGHQRHAHQRGGEAHELHAVDEPQHHADREREDEVAEVHDRRRRTTSTRPSVPTLSVCCSTAVGRWPPNSPVSR